MEATRYKAGGRAFAQIAQYHPELTALRRELHAHPELGFEERFTAARVKEALRQCGVDEIHEGLGTTGLVAVIRGQGHSSGAMVGLRADMDALPMVEHNEFPWKRSEEHTSELQSQSNIVCRLLLEKKNHISSALSRVTATRSHISI